jgi:hypothetical protein
LCFVLAWKFAHPFAEHGFYRTEQGRRHYMLNLQQIASSARLTTYAGIMDALLGARNQ